MSALFEDDDNESEPQNRHEFTVSELSGAVKRMIEGAFDHFSLRGELGRISRPRSGHIYLDLKDDRAVISGVIWKGVAARLSHAPEEGMEVVVTGRLTTFPGQSKYQIIIEDLKPAGAGALMAMLEARKAKLASEGLFDKSRKQAIPYLPEVIGVITSPSGAVIRDILHRLRDRFPRKVLLWPVAVQGERCADQVAAAIAGFNALSPGGALPRPDVLIVARGGGSIEDLWGFNEEAPARAVAASQIPVISAVGHETDTTLIDFVADLRAPTPTAAAEMAVPVRAELVAETARKSARAAIALSKMLQTRGQRLRDISRALPQPSRLLEGPAQQLDALSDRLPRGLKSNLSTMSLRLSKTAGHIRPNLLHRQITAHKQSLAKTSDRITPALQRFNQKSNAGLTNWSARLAAQKPTQRLARETRNQADLSRRFTRILDGDTKARRTAFDRNARLLETLSYRATLARGFAVMRDGEKVISSSKAVKSAKNLSVELSDGRVSLTGNETPKKAGKKPKNTPEQGSLF